MTYPGSEDYITAYQNFYDQFIGKKDESDDESDEEPDGSKEKLALIEN